MSLGQVAGTAACVVINAGKSLQSIDYRWLKKLQKNGQLKQRVASAIIVTGTPACPHFPGGTEESPVSYPDFGLKGFVCG